MDFGYGIRCWGLDLGLGAKAIHTLYLIFGLLQCLHHQQDC